MDASVVTAGAAVGGSLVGGLASFATTYLTQRHQVHTERLARELARRDELYVHFNELSAELMVDALDHSLDEVGKLVGLVTAMGRIRLVSSDAVLAAAEAVIACVLESYDRPAIEPRDILKAPTEFVAPLVAFTRACRSEREAMLRQI